MISVQFGSKSDLQKHFKGKSLSALDAVSYTVTDLAVASEDGILGNFE